MSALFQTRSDEDSRRLAQTEFDHPVAVEAGAGTGKTTVLVARVLSWSLGEGWGRTRDLLRDDKTPEPTEEAIATRVLEGLVAITFTEAAAAQMARRVAEALARIAADPLAPVVGFYPELLPNREPDRLGRRAKALIGVLDRLAIRTIHAHCRHLLTTYPMALGLAPDLEVDATGRHLEEIVRETVEAATKQAFADSTGNPMRTLAIRGGIDPRQVAAAVVELVADGSPSAAFDSDPLSAPQRTKMRQRLLSSLEKIEVIARPLTEQTRAQKDKETATALARSSSLLRDSSTEPDLQSLAMILEGLREAWTDDALERLARWSRGDFTQTVSNLVGDACQPLAACAAELLRLLRLYRQLDPEILDAARRALRSLIAEVETELRARGVVTYNSLMTEAWRLLHDHTSVLALERRRIDQLLVDEFQDTDRLQCDLVRFLALGGDKSERPGLFVVGDPKQSIYGWRDADLQAYEDFLEDLRAAGGVCLALNRNFRSVPQVLAEVDRSLSPVMQAEPGLQPAFAGLVPNRVSSSEESSQGAAQAPVEYWISWTGEGPKTRAEEAARLEASSIAADIRILHDCEDLPWSEFGLLLRSTSRLEVFLGAFRKEGVPFVVTSDKHYFRRREIIEAAALVRSVLVPVDHLALVALLRSATVGVPDAALLPLWQRQFPGLVTRLVGPGSPELDEIRSVILEVASQMPDDIPGLDEIEGWDSSLIAAVENLAHLRESFQNDPADKFVNRLRDRFLFDVTEASRHLGAYRLANLDRFFRELESAIEEREGDIQGVLRALRRSVAESREAEQALPEGATEEAVQVMTIHGAKGLEFGHVYLPQLHSTGRQGRQPEVRFDRRWQPGQQAEYVLFGSPTPGFDRVEARVSEIERTERVRTLYVAMTRARSRVVLLGNWPAEPVAVPTDKQTTYLDLLRSRSNLPLSLVDLESTCRAEKRFFTDHGEARWRFPFLESDRSGATAARPRKSGLPTIKVVRQQAARLEGERQRALGRMGRRYSGSASSEAADRLRRLAGDEIPFEDQGSTRDIALPVGSAFHRMMETWRLQEDPESELERQREIQHRWLTHSLTSDLIAPAIDRFEALMDRFQDSRFLRRFVELDPDSLSREVPVVVSPQDPDDGPVGFVSGFIDLVYHDRQTGEWLVIDYKTDPVQEESKILDRAHAYAHQEAVYARALQDSLDLPVTPRTQLWFIWPDYLWEETAAS